MSGTEGAPSNKGNSCGQQIAPLSPMCLSAFSTHGFEKVIFLTYYFPEVLLTPLKTLNIIFNNCCAVQEPSFLSGS